jgi:hypothetical protein
MSKREKLEVVTVESNGDVKRFDAMLRDEHYLGSGRPVGDFLRQAIIREGEWVGLLTWGACSFALQDRDEWIGWTRPLRAARQKLLVQNRRFLVPGKAREPNLASQVLGAAVKALPEQWMRKFGYTPILAETFTDIELFEGTCYRAAGWIPIGQTKGYGRQRADFYHFHNRPKKLWVRPLGGMSVDRARDVLCGELPDVCHAGAESNASGLLPIPEPQVYSLRTALQSVTDPRRSNRRFRCGTVLCIVAMAILSGARNISEIHRFGQRLKPKHRAKLGLPRDKKYPKLLEAPSYTVYYNLLSKISLDEFAKVLTDWLQAGRGKLPAALAMDGKMIRNLIGVLSISEHETGIPVAIAIQTEKKGDGEHCELEVAKLMLSKQAHILDGSLLSSDALHTHRVNAINVNDAGGDYLFQVRDNRRKLRKLASDKAAATPLLHSPSRNRMPEPVSRSN